MSPSSASFSCVRSLPLSPSLSWWLLPPSVLSSTVVSLRSELQPLIGSVLCHGHSQWDAVTGVVLQSQTGQLVSVCVGGSVSSQSCLINHWLIDLTVYSLHIDIRHWCLCVLFYGISHSRQNKSSNNPCFVISLFVHMQSITGSTSLYLLSLQSNLGGISE